MIITVYNKERYLNNLFGSIFSQDLTNVELIVVNDGSTDNSLKIISNYKIDKLINFEENIGIPSSRNRGIRESEGDYLWFIDADDLIVSCIIFSDMVCLLLSECGLTNFILSERAFLVLFFICETYSAYQKSLLGNRIHIHNSAAKRI